MKAHANSECKHRVATLEMNCFADTEVLVTVSQELGVEIDLSNLEFIYVEIR